MEAVDKTAELYNLIEEFIQEKSQEFVDVVRIKERLLRALGENRDNFRDAYNYLSAQPMLPYERDLIAHLFEKAKEKGLDDLLAPRPVVEEEVEPIRAEAAGNDLLIALSLFITTVLIIGAVVIVILPVAGFHLK
jgi:hypothetical protein